MKHSGFRIHDLGFRGQGQRVTVRLTVRVRVDGGRVTCRR